MTGNYYSLDICHVDMDAFYASIEESINPKLKNKPFVVGGMRKEGVVTTANYLAREYGVHSAMPIFQAKTLCPHLITVPVKMDLYKEISYDIFEILKDISPKVERLSIDEAYLDISHLSENPMTIAKNIQKQVYNNTGLTLSVGISYNKFLAKLASNWRKPKGIKIITHEDLPMILENLPIKEIYGIGRKTEDKLKKIGIYLVKDLYKLDKKFLIDNFGKSGEEIYYRIRGIDNRPIEVNTERKSIGIERTYSNHINELHTLEKLAEKYSHQLSQELKSKSKIAKRVSIKLKNSNFDTITRSYTLPEYTDSYKTISTTANYLVNKAYKKENFRLFGVSVSELKDNNIKQVNFFNN